MTSVNNILVLSHHVKYPSQSNVAFNSLITSGTLCITLTSVKTFVAPEAFDVASLVISNTSPSSSIYTAVKNFTLPPAVTARTNLTSDSQSAELVFEGQEKIP